jgi:2'-5' RNA ligase
MRLFIGIELPYEFKNHIAMSVAPMHTSGKGWENAHDYHMTLLFIGDTPEDKLEGIIQRLRQIHFSPLTLTFKTFAFFPRRVFYLSCEPSQELLNLKSMIESIYSEYVRVETKKFIPHITIKRFQRYEYDELRMKVLKNPFEGKKIVVDHLALFKSEKDSDNHKYHVLERTKSL